MWSAGCAFLNALFFDDGGWEFIFVRHYVRVLPFTSGLIQFYCWFFDTRGHPGRPHLSSKFCGLDRGVFGLEPRDCPARETFSRETPQVERHRAQSCAIALRSPAPERSSDLKTIFTRYSPGRATSTVFGEAAGDGCGTELHVGVRCCAACSGRLPRAKQNTNRNAARPLRYLSSTTVLITVYICSTTESTVLVYSNYRW
jgi:hypothetical protein